MSEQGVFLEMESRFRNGKEIWEILFKDDMFTLKSVREHIKKLNISPKTRLLVLDHPGRPSVMIYELVAEVIAKYRGERERMLDELSRQICAHAEGELGVFCFKSEQSVE